MPDLVDRAAISFPEISAAHSLRLRVESRRLCGPVSRPRHRAPELPGFRLAQGCIPPRESNAPPQAGIYHGAPAFDPLGSEGLGDRPRRLWWHALYPSLSPIGIPAINPFRRQGPREFHPASCLIFIRPGS